VPAAFAPILTPDGVAALRSVLSDITPDAVHDVLGPIGRAAHERGDLDGALRQLPARDPLATFVRLFLLGSPVPCDEARAALPCLPRVAFDTLIETTQDSATCRARLELRPYAEDAGPTWWVVSDFGSDVRPGPLAEDHVLGIGGASITLAQSTIRRPVARALDLGTGCGVQALHLSSHADQVVATDISIRALRLAATTAALSGLSWELRQGSLLEPVARESFDLIVSNPPFVVSPGMSAGSGGHDYRDSGLAGDDVCRSLLTGIPGLLAPEGCASMLANWIIPADGDWADRVGGWLHGRGCDAWVWQREVLEPGEYVSLWLRDAGETPGTARWSQRYSEWVEWFAVSSIPAVGMGLVTLWRSDAEDPLVICEEVPHAVEQPVGAHLPGWLARQRWLASHTDAALLGTALRSAPDLIRARFDLHSEDGWTSARTELRQSHGMRWELETDDAIAAIVGACSGATPLLVPVQVLAASLGLDPDEVSNAVVPVIRDLIARGFLMPEAIT
jgi:methylase of polypeptide subunit release factors